MKIADGIDNILLYFFTKLVRFVKSLVGLGKNKQAHALNFFALAVGIVMIYKVPEIDEFIVRLAFISVMCLVSLLLWGVQKVKETDYGSVTDKILRTGSVFYLLKRYRIGLAATAFILALSFIWIRHILIVLFFVYFFLLSSSLYTASVELSVQKNKDD